MKEGVMKKINPVFCFCIVCVCSFLLMGCAKITFRNNDYHGSTNRLDGWEVFTHLHGTSISSEEAGNTVDTTGAPYHLYICLSPNPGFQEVHGSVKIASIELYDTYTDLLVYKNNDALESEFKLHDGSSLGYSARFYINELNLEYTPYTLVLKYKITTDISVLERESKLLLKQNYSESKESLLRILLSQ